MKQPSLNTSENELAAIRQELNELRPMRRELNDLRQAFASLRANGNATSSLEATESSTLTDRRGMLKKVGALAAGVATAGLLRPSSSSAAQNLVSNPEATGSALIIGSQNNAPTSFTDITALRTTFAEAGSPIWPRLWDVQNRVSTGFSQPANTLIASLSYINNADGSPSSGTFYALFAQAKTPGGGTGIGVHGEGDDVGVEGFGIGGPFNAAVGCSGTADSGSSLDIGVRGLSVTGRGGSFIGGRAAVTLALASGAVNNPNASAPIGGGTGDLYRSSAGLGGTGSSGLWYRADGVGGNPYRRVADATTAGALTFLGAPLRLVDTRNGTGDPMGAYVDIEVRTYNIATLASLPTGARAMVGRITVAFASTAGQLQVDPSNAFGTGTAVINFPAASIFPAFGVPLISALDSSGNIHVRSSFGSSPGTLHVIIDILGFYL